MGDFFGYIKNAFGEFLNGMLGEILDWLLDFLDKITEGLSNILDSLLSIFDGIPKILKFLDTAFRTTFCFCPPIFFDILYLGIAVVFIVILIKLIMKLFGKG